MDRDIVFDTIHSIINTFKEYPGTIAWVGFIGVIIFGALNWVPLMMISMFAGLIGYLVYQSQHKPKKREPKEKAKNGSK